MQRTFIKVIVLSLGIALSVVAYQKAPAKPKAPKAPKVERLSGTVRMISKDKSEISLRQSSSTTGAERIVIYSAKTEFKMGSTAKSTPSSIDQVKEGNYMYCGGKFEGVKLAADTCTFRAQK